MTYARYDTLSLTLLHTIIHLDVSFIAPILGPSIHPYLLNPGWGLGGSRPSRLTQTPLSHATFSSSFWGIPRRSQASWVIKPLQRVLGLPRGLLLVGRAWKTSTAGGSQTQLAWGPLDVQNVYNCFTRPRGLLFIRVFFLC